MDPGEAPPWPVLLLLMAAPAAVIVKAYSGGDPSFLWCDRKGGCAGEDEEDLICTDERLLACVVRWLGSPAKEGT